MIFFIQLYMNHFVKSNTYPYISVGDITFVWRIEFVLSNYKDNFCFFIVVKDFFKFYYRKTWIYLKLGVNWLLYAITALFN